MPTQHGLSGVDSGLIASPTRRLGNPINVCMYGYSVLVTFQASYIRIPRADIDNATTTIIIERPSNSTHNTNYRRVVGRDSAGIIPGKRAHALVRSNKTRRKKEWPHYIVISTSVNGASRSFSGQQVPLAKESNHLIEFGTRVPTYL